jgi:hypothetical protein
MVRSLKTLGGCERERVAKMLRMPNIHSRTLVATIRSGWILGLF